MMYTFFRAAAGIAANELVDPTPYLDWTRVYPGFGESVARKYAEIRRVCCCGQRVHPDKSNRSPTRLPGLGRGHRAAAREPPRNHTITLLRWRL